VPEYTIVWRETAETELGDLYHYIVREHGLPDPAFAFTERIRLRCNRIIDAPLGGRARDEIVPGLRSIAFESVVILYTIADTEIVVTNIVHGARDYERLLRDRPK
jgi:toxin ParE1/3/4